MRAPLLALVAMFTFMNLLAGGVAAQEATPAPITAIELAPGVTAEVFAAVPSTRAPGQTVYLARFVFQPGAEIFPHSHPGTTVLGVDAGTLGWTLLKGTAHVVRGAAAGATGPIEDITDPGRRSSCSRGTPSPTRTTSSTPLAVPAMRRQWCWAPWS